MTVVLWGSETYADRVAAAYGSSLRNYYKLNEASGANALDYSGGARHAPYGGGEQLANALSYNGLPCPRFDGGVSDKISLTSAGQLSWWTGNEFTVHLWAKANSWVSGAWMRMLQITADASNFLSFGENATTGNLYIELVAAGVSAATVVTTASTTNWYSISATHSRSNNRFRVYLNGSMVYNVSSPGIWAGAVAGAHIGASNTGFNAWDGWLSDVSLGNTELTALPA